MPARSTPIKTFWKHVDVSHKAPCWEWTSAKSWNGYGQFGCCGKGYRAHRFIWEYLNPNIDTRKKDICHTCNNRWCVNPQHLYLGTRQDNMNDAKKGGTILKLENHPNAKLTDMEVRGIRIMCRGGLKRKEIASIFNICIQHVNAIYSRRSRA